MSLTTMPPAWPPPEPQGSLPTATMASSSACAFVASTALVRTRGCLASRRRRHQPQLKAVTRQIAQKAALTAHTACALAMLAVVVVTLRTLRRDATRPIDPHWPRLHRAPEVHHQTRRLRTPSVRPPVLPSLSHHMHVHLWAHCQSARQLSVSCQCSSQTWRDSPSRRGRQP